LIAAVAEGKMSIFEEAVRLSADKRAKLVDALLSSLDKPDAEIDRLWAAEAESRIDAHDRGEIEVVSRAERRRESTWGAAMKMPIEKEEKDLIESFEADEWKPAGDREQELARYTSLAKNAERKDCRINIRLSQRDLLRLKAIALEEGIPYQTLASSVLHKYGTGVLTEERRTAG
jgi:predicted DNA binding CopG/RHH family protein